MRTIAALILFLCSTVSYPLPAQSQYNSADDSDPQAIKMLQQIGSQYDNNKVHKIDFSLDIELPGQAKESQKGELIQDKDKFILDMEGRKIISDSETVWMYLKELNEVQINDADFEDAGEFSTPSDIFNLHTSKDFVFVISSSFQEQGIAVTQIEAKPLDKDSDYSKMRLTVQDEGLEVGRLKIFYKDGSRFTMNILSHDANYKLGPHGFIFDATKYPDVHIEDLRF